MVCCVPIRIGENNRNSREKNKRGWSVSLAYICLRWQNAWVGQVVGFKWVNFMVPDTPFVQSSYINVSNLIMEKRKILYIMNKLIYWVCIKNTPWPTLPQFQPLLNKLLKSDLKLYLKRC